MRYLRQFSWLALLALTAFSAHGQAGAFGSAVAFAGDELLVGEPATSFRPGTVYVFRKSGPSWRGRALIGAPRSSPTTVF